MSDDFFNKSEGERLNRFLVMTREQAQQYFNEYLGRAEERIRILRELFHGTGGGSTDALDFSPSSLVPLWHWASTRLRARDFTAAELAHINNVPESLRSYFLERRLLSNNSFDLVDDVGYYLGETLIRNCPGVTWGIGHERVDRYVHENQPVLKGFRVDVSPRDSVYPNVIETISGRHKDDALLQIFDNCRTLLPSIGKANAPGLERPKAIKARKRDTMSWRAGGKMFREMWPLLQKYIEQREYRSDFAKRLIAVFEEDDMDPVDLRHLDPELDEILDEIDVNPG
jgi:hypothetical protein